MRLRMWGGLGGDGRMQEWCMHMPSGARIEWCARVLKAAAWSPLPCRAAASATHHLVFATYI